MTDDKTYRQDTLFGASLVAQWNEPIQVTWVWSLGGDDPLEKKRKPTPVFLRGKSHRQSSLESLQSMGSKSAGHDLAHTHICFYYAKD